MKKIIFLFSILTILTITLSAQSYLNVSTMDDREITASLDNLQLDEPGNYAEFDNLQGDSYQLTVFNSYSNGQLGTPKPIYSGYIKVPFGSAIYASIDDYGNLVIYKRIPYNEKERYFCSNNYRRPCKGKYENKDKDRSCYGQMKDDDFKSLLKSIGNGNFESGNLDIAKTALDKNIVTSEQVAKLMTYFTFEGSKLEIAKHAYPRTCDQKNYFKVYDSFGFSSSITELKNFIDSKK